MNTRSPSVWSVGDRAIVGRNFRPARVIIRAFRRHLVEVEYPDGSRVLRSHSALRRMA